MLNGFLLLTGTGICWAGLAAVTAAGAVRDIPASRIQPYSAFLVLLCCTWAALAAGPGILPDRAAWFQIICLTAAGACNYFMLNLVQRAMKSGREGVVWTFTQSSMIWPFLMGICCFGEAAAAMRFSGFFLIIAGLICFAAEKKNTPRCGGWLWPAAGAFLLSGMAQCCASIPSYFQITGMSALRRMLLTQCGIIAAFLLDSLIRRKLEFPKSDSEKKVWKLAAIFGGFNLAALLFFYNGLNLLADAGCASAGYPAAQGLGVVLFFAAGCFKNLPGIFSLCGFLLISGGIALLAIGSCTV